MRFPIPLMVLSVIFGLITASVAVSGVPPQVNKDPATDALTLATIIIAVANIILICVIACSLWFTRKAHARAESIFVGENHPLIDVTPIGIGQNADGTQAVTVFSIVNYSGFKAFNIGIDLKYGSNNWILEWRKARDEKIAKGQAEGVVREKLYMSAPNVNIRKIRPGETKERDEEGNKIEIIGALNLEGNVCTKGDKGFPVWVRVTWQNLNRHVFDEVHQYRLICTKDTELTDPGGGRAFTFIPEGVISQKAGVGSNG